MTAYYFQFNKRGNYFTHSNFTGLVGLGNIVIMIWFDHLNDATLSAGQVDQYIDTYHNTSNISRTLLSSKIVDNSDVVGASLIGAAKTTSSFST